ncbi:MAG: cation transporter [Lachnospiraceae bacterium]|nr:cation transporter [Lachnospiraceae bacterium]
MEKSREKIIIQTSITGIVANVFLAAFKAFVGLVSNSIAVTLDAVNNLSDAISSVITIVGTKLAGKKPDKKHPLGYGRIEYMSAAIVSGIVLYAGITSCVESIKKIIHPEKPDYNTVSLVIIAVAVLVKIVLGKFVKSRGEKVNSGSLIASGSDAMFDAVLSASVLATAIIFVVTGVSLGAFVGIVISAFIVKAGIEMMRDTMNEILGARADKALTDKIKALLREIPGVRGAYDLVIYNYGPDKNYASVHLELPDNMPVNEVDRITRKAEALVYSETGVFLVGVGVYSYNTDETSEDFALMNKIKSTVTAYEWALSVHGFYIDKEEMMIRFDVVLSFDIKASEAVKILYGKLCEEYPEYKFVIAPDVYVSD